MVRSGALSRSRADSRSPARPLRVLNCQLPAAAKCFDACRTIIAEEGPRGWKWPWAALSISGSPVECP